MKYLQIQQLRSSPFFLLIVCGFLFSLKIMLAKASLSAGMQPFQLAIVINLGSGMALLPWLISSGEKIQFKTRYLSLYLALGIVSVAVPTILSYLVLEKVGPAYASTVYSLSPLLTMVFAALVGIELMFYRRVLGIFLGLAGMVALIQQQIVQIRAEDFVWIFVGLLIPASAAVGNVLRSAFWPQGASALAFSCGTLFVSTLLVALISPLFESIDTWRFFEPRIILWTTVLIIISAMSSIMNFRLQQIGGSVVFSQIGYWGTGFGVLLAAGLFGDKLSLLSLLGLVCIIYGGILSRKKVDV